ncbi:MAG: LysM domain-containing protein [Thermodesulfobacteriota bacterium]|nr:LysM domain-containing protein [Thermodesulfobacteriota bacterium]
MCNCSDAADAARSRSGRECDETTEQCSDYTVHVRFMFDDGDADTGNDRTLTHLNVSNLVTSDHLPNGFGPDADGTADPDHFKIEIDDPGASGSSIPDNKVTLEALKPDGSGGFVSFNPPRRLQAECQRVSGSTGGTENKYRSRYLRLVTDTEDQNANSDQCLRTDWDPNEPEVEILDQVVRLSYESSKSTTETSQAPVGQNKGRIRMSLYVVRGTPGTAGTGAVTTDQATTRLRKWFRRCYAQAEVAPQLVSAVDEVEPPRNMVVVSNNSGANATGNTDNWMRFFIRDVAGIRYNVVSGDTMVRIASRHGIANWRTIYNHAENAAFRALRPNPDRIYVGDEIYIPAEGNRVAVVHYPAAGATPIATAQALAAKAGTAGLNANAFQNDSRPGDAAGSADLLIKKTDGTLVTLENEVSNDTTQTLIVARVTITDFLVSSNNAAAGFSTHNIGSQEQRALVRNYRTANNRVECFVLNTIRYDDLSRYIRGRSVLPRMFRPAAERASFPLLISTYMAGNTMGACDNTDAGDSSDANPFTFPHECGHAIIDVFHATNNRQMMRSGTSGTNAVNASKRIYDSDLAFNGMGGASPLNQVQRLRTSGAAVLGGW